nr:MAG TPA: tail tube protein [Caudoviricetes sp.]
MDKNKIWFGIKYMHLAKIVKDDSTGIEYGTILPLPGAQKISYDPKEEGLEIPADNGIYYAESTTTKEEGELELVVLDDDILTTIFGAKKDENGAIIEGSGDKTALVALLGQIEGDKYARRFIMYKVKLIKPSFETETTGTGGKKVNSRKIKYTAYPVEKDNVIKATLPYSDEKKEVYNKFFTEIYKPKFPEA